MAARPGSEDGNRRSDQYHQYELPHGDQVVVTPELQIPIHEDGQSWGATVVPFCIAPDSTVYIALGLEQPRSFGISHERPDRPDRPTPSLWCGFGGQHEGGESDIERVAAREYYEETCGVLQPTENVMYERLRQRKWHTRVNMVVNHGARDDIPRRYYVGYLVQVPYQPAMSDAFLQKTGRLWTLCRLANEYRAVCAHSACRAVGYNGILGVHIAEGLEGPKGPGSSAVVWRHCPEAGTHTCTAQCLQYATSAPSQASGDEVALLALLVRLHLQLRLLLLEEGYTATLGVHLVSGQPLVPPVAHATDYEYVGVPDIHPQYLEKQCLRWFSLPHLRNWLHEAPMEHHHLGPPSSAGPQHVPMMRRNFRPMLDLMVRELEKDANQF